MSSQERKFTTVEVVAGNGLLNRRMFLSLGSAAGLATMVPSNATETPLTVSPWSITPGSWLTEYGTPSKFEGHVNRGPITPGPLNRLGGGSIRTPLHLLEGTITANGLHFERSHAGIPDIDPDAHRLVIHGLVKRPLMFTLEALSRYPMTTRTCFVECAGNSLRLNAKEPVQGTAQELHGLLSCSEWTGVSLATLLDEVGVDPEASWLLAEGADAALMSRSVPIAKAMDDAMIALYQNGERIRPSNGYPIRLLLPGYEGNMSVKWLRRLKAVAGPIHTKDETSKYSMLLADGRVAQFNFPMEAKSVITKPSPSLTMKGPGLYEISGLAWSGNGRITRVEVSADGGKSWASTALTEPVLSKALTRFRIPWRWDGQPSLLQSRATDETGYVQPTREAQHAARGSRATYHCNVITTWAIGEGGEVTHVYA